MYETLNDIFNNITISMNTNIDFTNLLLLKACIPKQMKKSQLLVDGKNNEDNALSTNETVPNQIDKSSKEYIDLKLNFFKNNCSILSSKHKSIAKKTSTFLFVPPLIFPKFILKSKESSYIRFKNNECKLYLKRY